MTAALPSPPPPTGWRGLVELLRPRPNRAQAIVALLVGLLGFAIAAQVHVTRSGGTLATARQTDLIGLLGDLTARADRLRGQIAALEVTEAQLTAGTGGRAAALAAAKARLQTLGILAGTLPATGPGIALTINDPGHQVRADVLLDALEELRGAGAEVIQIGPVRVVASTALLDAANRNVTVDGVEVAPPYAFLVIGDPKTLAAALGIPGGVLDTVDARPGASATVDQLARVTIRALHPAGAGQ
ncbi:MAG TPA: DUF881 domain-containing protein [Mycobacteriales bacterium]|nr:DUF881 domain-containing protein [Mycobacteriales bacterium]